MNRKEFRELIEKKIVCLDGATGTNLQLAGMPTGVCPEYWIMNNPDALIKLQRDFVEAGSDIVYAPTFTGNRIKLKEYDLEDRIVEINTSLVNLSKEAVGGKAYVAGDMTMTGQQLYPMGELTFDELIDVYKEQAQILYDAGVDLFVVETMMSLQETRAAIFAIREVTTDLPILASLTFEKDGRTLYGTSPQVAATVLSSLDVDGLGLNCSTGPESMVDIVKAMYEYSNVPIMVKPNAGLPLLVNGSTIYRMTPDSFANASLDLVKAGARIVGGCCGTTKDHIKRLNEVLEGQEMCQSRTEKRRVLTSERELCEIKLDGNFLVIGERINPTGKKKLQEELRAGKMNIVRQFAREQTQNGAAILDINMGTNGIDENQSMLKAIEEVSAVTDLPLCLDSSYPEVIENALKHYPGRALINSISCETEKFEKLIPIAKKYGAMFILLPVSDEGIPKTLEEKHAVLDSHVKMALDMGIDREDIVVDGLVATVGADKEAALSCLRTFEHCKKDLEIPTVCGLSNISFGMPERSFVNTAFLTMSIAGGLTMAIANPSQDLLMNAAFATDMLMNKDGSDLRYINRAMLYSKKKEEEEAKLAEKYANMAGLENLDKGQNGAADGTEKGQIDPVYKAVLDGDKESIVELSKVKVENGQDPSAVINDYLIPAINEVGKLYDEKKYFLPQLIASANAMKEAIAYLEPLIKKDDSKKLACIVFATVEGDVHDIGKNLVVLMLKNYGYDVIDLGKDVEANLIVDTAIENNAAVIGLSALMTTTMMNMKKVVEAAKEKGYKGKIVIGGAAVTESFAKEIGADGYSSDAADCVKLVKRLLGD